MASHRFRRLDPHSVQTLQWFAWTVPRLHCLKMQIWNKHLLSDRWEKDLFPHRHLFPLNHLYEAFGPIYPDQYCRSTLHLISKPQSFSCTRRLQGFRRPVSRNRDLPAYHRQCSSDYRFGLPYSESGNNKPLLKLHRCVCCRKAWCFESWIQGCQGHLHGNRT